MVKPIQLYAIFINKNGQKPYLLVEAPNRITLAIKDFFSALMHEKIHANLGSLCHA
jgi:hypothetical protein